MVAGLLGGALTFYVGDWFAVVAAVFLSNVPASLSAAVGLRNAGHSPRWILGLWLAVAVVAAAAGAAGYGLLGDSSRATVVAQAFAAGATVAAAAS